jgi:primosomal replication protein N
LNQVEIQATLAQAKALRYTPAGIPALDVQLEHQGEAVEVGQIKTVKVSLNAVTFGLNAEQLQKVSIGAMLRVKGFLDSARNGKSVVLHITEFESIIIEELKDEHHGLCKT